MSAADCRRRERDVQLNPGIGAGSLSVLRALPSPAGRITLRDLKRCKLSNIFFDTFFNIEKYLDHEQKDPFSVIRVSRLVTAGSEEASVGGSGSGLSSSVWDSVCCRRWSRTARR